MSAAALFDRLSQGRHRLPCPECAKTTIRPRDTALSVEVTADGGVYLCHRCAWRGGWRSNAKQTLRIPSRAAPRAQLHLSLAAHWRALWDLMQPIAGTALEYLLARRCAIPPKDGDLRCTEALRHPSGYIGPALVALVTDTQTREPLTLHRTWIRADGSKERVSPPRLLLGKHRKQGGVIRLYPDEAVTSGLAIAEGIETALTVATVYRPVWSAIDAGNLAVLPVVAGIEELLIMADHDAAGLRAASECATRWHGAGRRVRIAVPPQPGEDANEFGRRAA